MMREELLKKRPDTTLARTKEMNRVAILLRRAGSPEDVEDALLNMYRQNTTNSADYRVRDIHFFIIRRRKTILISRKNMPHYCFAQFVGNGYSARTEQQARRRFGGRPPTRLYENSQGGTGHAGERMGEADHPGPTRLYENSRGGTGHAGERMGEADHPGPKPEEYRMFGTDSDSSDNPVPTPEQARDNNLFGTESDEFDSGFDSGFAQACVAEVDEAEVKPKVKLTAAKALVQKGIEDLYYVERQVEKKGVKLIALGGKPEPEVDSDDMAVLKRELREESNITVFTCVEGPVKKGPGKGTNYFHVRTDQTPVSKDAIVVGLTLRELWAATNKDHTVKTALSEFTTKPPRYTCSVRDDVHGLLGTCTSSMALLTYNNLYYVEVRKGKCRPFGGACEPPDMESFETLNRTMAQAAGDCAYKGSAWVSWGPILDENIAYRGIEVKFKPVAQKGFELRSFASLDDIRMTGGSLHFRLGRILKILDENKDNKTFFHSEQEAYDTSDGDGDISSSPEPGDVSDYVESQKHDVQQYEEHEQWSQNNSTVAAFEATTSRFNAVSITPKTVYALVQYKSRCYVLEKDKTHHLIGGPYLPGEVFDDALKRHMWEQAAVRVGSIKWCCDIRGNFVDFVEADREPEGKGNLASFASIDQLQAMDNNSDFLKEVLSEYKDGMDDEQV
jgi:hypothetical protein